MNFGNFFQILQSAVSEYAGWFFIWTMNITLVFVLSLLVSRFGDIRMGGPDARPEFSTISWFAMLFSAGMGIGVIGGRFDPQAISGVHAGKEALLPPNISYAVSVEYGAALLEAQGVEVI